MDQLPTLGQLWSNNVVDSLNSKSANSTQANTNNMVQVATNNVRKRTAKKQALADQLTSTPNTQQGIV